MILAHVSNWGYSEIGDMEVHELYFWCNESKKLLKKMNPQ